MTEFNPNTFAPTHTMWLEKTPTYVGDAVARLEGYGDPFDVHGSAIVKVEETGDCTITMDVADQGNVTFDNLSSQEVFEMRGQLNCTRIEVTTDNGVYIAEGELNSSVFFKKFRRMNQVHCIPQQGEFRTKSDRTPKYWTIPLLNFFGLFLHRPEYLESHPLAFVNVTSLRRDLGSDGAPYAEHFIDEHVGILQIGNNNDRLFVQGMPDYRRIVTELQNNSVPTAITSVMVGELADGADELPNMETMLSYGILPVLSLVTGCEVGATWCEYRDAEGQLVRRVHRRWATPKFRTRKPAMTSRSYYAAAEGDTTEGVGALLAKATESSLFGELKLRVVCNHVRKAHDPELTLDDQVEQVCRAFDALYTLLAIADTKLALHVTSMEKASLESILDEAAMKISGLADAASLRSDIDAAHALRTIADKVKQGWKYLNRRSQFGHKVLSILNHAGLQDGHVLEEAFRRGELPLPRGWADAITALRNEVTHDGHISSTFRSELLALRIRNHLHDIVVRVLLKELGYAGSYNPIVLEGDNERALDWVNPSISAAQLGYQ